MTHSKQAAIDYSKEQIESIKQKLANTFNSKDKIRLERKLKRKLKELHYLQQDPC